MYDESYTFYTVHRILAGEIPYSDFDMGYGVLWYYPTVLLFKIFGETFNVMRIFAFSILGATGVLSFYIVDKITKNRVVAYVAALSILIFHAGTHKAMLPFCAALSTLVFIECNFSKNNKFIPFMISGFGTGVISLIRPEHGWASAFLLFMFALSSAVSEKRTFSPYLFCRNVFYACLGIALAYLPLIVFGARYGFLDAFLRKQTQFVTYCVSLVLSSFLGDSGNFIGAPLTNRPRLPLAQMTHNLKDFVLGVATYCSPVLLAAAAIGAFLAPREQAPGKTLPAHIRHTGVILISLSPTFFSFFSFQPALWHYYQVVPSMILLLAVLTGKRLQYGQDDSRPLARRSLSVICLFGIILIAFTVMPPVNQSNLAFGPLTLSYSNDRLEIPSLVSSRMPTAEVERITSLLSALDRYTTPDDTVAVYPYFPGLYALSKRKPFNRRLYIDDQALALDPDWCKKEVKRFEDNPPKAVFMCDWPINRTEHSRFSNWAKPVYEHVVNAYQPVHTQADGECRLYILK